MKPGLNRILSRVRIHGGDSGVSARATHHNVEKDLLITYVSALSSQADLGNVSRSTTERKKMSTKTSFKRVALVAVAALGMGVLTSVSPASAVALGTNSSSWPMTDTTSAASGGASLVAQGVGLIANSLTNGDTVTAGAAEAVTGSYLTFTAPSSGALTSVASGDKQTLTIVGNAEWSSFTKDGGSAATVTLSADKKTLTATATDTSTMLATAVLRLTGTGSVTAKIAQSNPAISTSIVISSIASSSESALGVVSTTTSSVTAITASGDSADTAGADDARATSLLNGAKGFLKATVKDALGKGIAGQLVATVEANNGFVKIQAVSGGSTAGTTNLATQTTVAGTAYEIVVSQKTANVAATVAVKVTFNGVTLATKSFSFLGDVTSITAAATGIGAADAATSNTGITLVAKDAAGNAVTTTATAIAASTLAATTVVSAINTIVQPIVVSRDTSTATAGTAKYVCTTLGGTQSVTFTATNAAGVVVTSNAVTLSCAGNSASTGASVKAAFDKTSYKTGEIATLTLTFKDGDGRLVNDVAAISSETITVDAGSALAAVVAPNAADKAVSGVKTYKFIVGQTAGSFQAIVKVPSIATEALGNTSTLSFAVTSQGASEIAQLVKVIGTLLTTFTKQITALIKALKK